MGVLSGSMTIVTGGGQGIGRSIAIGYANEGAKVLIVSRTQSDLESVTSYIQDGGGEAQGIAADVSSESDVQRIVKCAIEVWGRIDVLVNNAGIPGPSGNIHELDVNDVRGTIETNLYGPFLCSRAVVPYMMEQGGGNIINVSSGAGQRKSRDIVRSLPYQMSKFGLEGLTNGLAVQLQSSKINVNSLLPGPVATRLHRDTKAEVMASVGSRFREPEDVVPAAIFLAIQPAGEFTDQIVEAGEFL